MPPVTNYKQLGDHDIEQLTRILSRTQDDERHRPLLSELPPHLKSRVPCMTSGCSRHKRLNMAPLDGLAAELQREIFHSAEKIWKPLNEAGSFDCNQQDMFGALQALQNLQTDRCSACWLHFLGSHRDASVALGSLIIGRVSPGIYQKSKRLIWIEESLRQKAGRDIADIEIRRMWEGGIGLRRVRMAAVAEGDRGFVVEYARLAREMDGLGGGRDESARSSRSRKSTVEGSIRLKEQPGDDRARTENPPADHFVCPASRPSAPKPPPKAHSAPTPQTGWHQQEARARSSMYSRPTPTASQRRPDSSRSSWWNNPRPDVSPSSIRAQIIELYRHSKFPEHTAFDARSSTDSRKRSPIDVFGRVRPEDRRGAPSRRVDSQQR